MLTSAQQSDFVSLGAVRVPGVFSPADANAMVDRLWLELHTKHGLRRDDPSTWSAWGTIGLQDLRLEPEFLRIGNAKLIHCINDLFNDQNWPRPKHWGQFLIRFPAPQSSWVVPHKIWHTDFEYTFLPHELFGLLVISLMTDVPAQSGGTSLLLGSHQYIAQYVQKKERSFLSKMKRVRKDLLASDPALVKLSDENHGQIPQQRNEELMREQISDSGIPLRATEVTGERGDVWLVHPWLLHASSMNVSNDTTLMCVQRLYRQAKRSNSDV